MKAPLNMLWSSIGDVFYKTFKNDEDRRAIELFWQTILDNSSDNLAYINHLKSLKSVMTAQVFAPYGNMPVQARFIEETPGQLVRLQFLQNGVISYYSSRSIQARSVNIDDSSYSISPGNSIPLKTGGVLTRTLINKIDDPGVSDGYVFLNSTDLSGSDRWSDFLPYPVSEDNSGLIFAPQNIDMCGIKDSTYMSGGYPFKIVFKGNISVLGVDSAVDITSYSDVGTAYHVQIRRDEIIDGLHGSENTQSISSPIGDFEIELIYDNINKKMKSNIYIGETLYETNWVSVSPSRRNHSFVVINNSSVRLQYIIDKEGKRWNGESNIKDIYVNSEEFPFLYSMSEPIVSCDYITTEPYMLSILATSSDNNITIDEEWLGYYPNFIRVGEDFGEIQEDLTLTGFELEDGDVDILPWYLKSNEFKFIETGIVASRYRFPQDVMYLKGAMAREVGLYERFGKLLGVPERPDSKEYLSILQGVNYALRKSRTITEIERACDIMLGVPFTVYGGPYFNYGSYVDQVSGGIKYYVDVGNERIFVSELSKVKNEILDPMESVMDGTYIEDWVNVPSLYDNQFSRWGKFKIVIPGYVGMSKFVSSVMVDTIKRAKDPHKSFNIETRTNINEQIVTRNTMYIQTNSYVVEDMIFDDYDSVMGNPIGYEKQIDSDGQLDSGIEFDSGRALDSYFLTRPKPKLQNVGSVMGQNYDSETRLLPSYLLYGNSDVLINRESDDPFWAEDQLRMVSHGELPDDLKSIYGVDYNYVPRARCIHWVYQDGSSEIMYSWLVNPVSDFSPVSLISGDIISCDSHEDVTLITEGSDVYEYTSGWDSTSTPTSINDLCYHISSEKIIAAGNTSKVYEKSIGDPSWTDITPSGSDNIYSVNSLNYTNGEPSPYFVVAGANGFVKSRDTDGSSWVDVSVSTSETFMAIHGLRDGKAFAVGTNGIIKGTDSFSSWDDYTIPSTSKTLTGVWCLADDAAWCCADDGTIYGWDGVNWSLVFTASEALSSIFVSREGTITSVGENGCVVRNAGYGWYEEAPYTAVDLNKVKNNIICGDSETTLSF